MLVDAMRVERWNGRGTPDERALRRRLEQEGYSVYAWTDAPGTTYPPHAHGEDQSHWVLEGSIALVVAGEEYILGPGDRDWLPRGTVHSARVVGSAPVTYLVAARNLPTSR